MMSAKDMSSSPLNADHIKRHIDWLDDDKMVSEIEKLTNELKSRSVSLDEDCVNLSDISKPSVKSNYHSEVKDGIKEFEIDGQKFRRKYQRHIQLEKHVVKQVFTFSGNEDSILDIDIAADPESPQIDNDVFYNLNVKNLSEETKNMLSPKIVIRSLKQSTVKDNLLDSNVDTKKSADTSFEKSEIKSFINKYGCSDFSELVIDKKTSKNLRESFLSQWQKCETRTTPNVKSKTISCVERFSSISSNGKVLHQSTCVQMTRSLLIRSKDKFGNIENISINDCESRKSQIPVIFKIDVTNSLMYNEKYDPSVEECKYLSISAGHVDALIAHACSIGVNTTDDYHLFHKVFVVTHPLFISTVELLNKLTDRYKYFSRDRSTVMLDFGDIDIDSNPDLIREELLTAVINLLVELINQFNRPMSAAVEEILIDFSEYLNKSGNIKEYLIIHCALRDLSNRIKLKENRRFFIQQKRERMNVEHGGKSMKSLFDFDGRVMSEQITLLESEYFDEIELEDLLGFTSACNNFTLMNCVHFFNNLTFWVKTHLFFDPERSNHEREKLFCKFLELLQFLKSHRNFSSYASILFSLIDFPEKMLSKRTRQRFSDESQFMSLSNKKLYLDAIHSAEYPYIPLLADIFSHLTRINEIMPTFIKDEQTKMSHVNFKKMWQYFMIIQYFVVKNNLPPEKKYYRFHTNADIVLYINDFKDNLTESQLFRCREQLSRTKSSKKQSPKHATIDLSDIEHKVM